MVEMLGPPGSWNIILKNIESLCQYLKEISIMSQPSKCLKFMTFGSDVLSYGIECKYLSEALETFYHH